MAAWMLHGTCVGEGLLLLAMKGSSCVRRVRLGSFRAQVGSSLVFWKVWLFMCAWSYALVESLVAESQCDGCMIVVMFCCHVRRYMRVCHVMLQNAVCNGCLNVAWCTCWGGNLSTKPCVFHCFSVQNSCSGRWSSSCVRRVRLGWFRAQVGSSLGVLGVLQRVVVHVCVWFYALVESLGARSQCNGCMIVAMFCCHVRRYMRVWHVMPQKHIVMATWMFRIVLGRKPEHKTLFFSLFLM